MAHVIERVQQVPALLTAPRAVALVSVPWSPWPQKSRDVLAVLERSRELWLPDTPVEFFDLWPERDDKLNRWYEGICQSHALRFELHGHGYGPLWWLAGGVVLGCQTKPYELPLESLQERAAAYLRTGGHGT
jgi:hypothetical protein